MKHSFTPLCTLALMLGAASFAIPHSAAAQSEPPSAPSPAESVGGSGPTKVAVILFQQAVAQTNEGQRNFAELREKFAPKEAQLKTQSDEIDTLKKQLQAAGSSLSEPERDARLRAIDEKTKALQRSAEDDQNDANSEMNQVYQALAQKVFAVVDAYAKQHGYTVVLDASNQQNSPVLWVSPASDITKAIVQAYNVKSGVAAPSPSTATHTGATHTGRSTTRPQ